MKTIETTLRQMHGTIVDINQKKRTVTARGFVLNKIFVVAADAAIATGTNPTADVTDLKIGSTVEIQYEDSGPLHIARRIAESDGANRLIGRR